MSATIGRPARSAMLGEALRRCETTPCAGLRVEPPGVRSIATAWLEEAANVGGGLVWRPRDGRLWLLGGTPACCGRALDLLRGMGWAADALDFPRHLPTLHAALAVDAEAPPATATPPASPAGLEGRVARLPPEAGHCLQTVWRMGHAGPRLLGQRWMPDVTALPGLQGADWSGHAWGLLAGRLLARAGRGSGPGHWPAQRKANLPLLLDLPWMPPPAALPPPPEGPGHALVLPLPSLLDLTAWSGLAAGAGWGLAWSGMTPSLAHLLDRLPGGHVFAAPGAPAGFPVSDRLILSGLADRAALAGALAAGWGICSGLGE